MNAADPVFAVFVYGTLKTGQCREACWPQKPLRIDKVWTFGELYDTGPYPALFAGRDKIAGELWTFDTETIASVLEALDEVEEYQPGQEATNLYNRVIVQCADRSGSVHQAYTYFYGRMDERKHFGRIEPSYRWEDGCFALWPAGCEW